jgi:demethylmenaquinone methyltransferase / 2-methoxy-6-polyprenyl-1,4-benzoquinol methylase
MTRPDLTKRPSEVAAMFDAVAQRYDLLNDVLSMGQVRFWRRRVARIVGAAHPERVLDLAAGTGTSTRTFERNGARAVACDFSLGMLQAGDATNPVAGDGLNLPFMDESFDLTTISYGLRNMQDTKRALQEMYRVTRPGGYLVIAEFSEITFRPLNTFYDRFVAKALPAIAQRVGNNPDAYEYLAESIKDWPNQHDLAALIEDAGWTNVKWQDLTLGVVAVHVARRPE